MVLSRALSLAAVTLVVGCAAMGQVAAQENLDAGKSPSQLFSGTCTACHKSARGLLKTVSPSSLQGFLRQHYTTSPEMAGVLASYLMSNGATDTRYGDKQKGGKGGKDGKETRSEAKPTARPEEAGAAPEETERPLRKRLVRPAEAPEAAKPAAEGQVSQSSEHERRKARRLSKRSKPGAEEEAPKGGDKVETPSEPGKEGAAGGEPARSDTAKVEPASSEPIKPEPVRAEPVRSKPAVSQPAGPEAAKPEQSAKSVESAAPLDTKPVETKPAESPSQSANADANKPQVNEALPPSLRRDPVPPVTPAATATTGATSAEPSVTASAPPPSPAEPTSPPVPPISH